MVVGVRDWGKGSFRPLGGRVVFFLVEDGGCGEGLVGFLGWDTGLWVVGW